MWSWQRQRDAARPVVPGASAFSHLLPPVVEQIGQRSRPRVFGAPAGFAGEAIVAAFDERLIDRPQSRRVDLDVDGDAALRHQAIEDLPDRMRFTRAYVVDASRLAMFHQRPIGAD